MPIEYDMLLRVLKKYVKDEYYSQERLTKSDIKWLSEILVIMEEIRSLEFDTVESKLKTEKWQHFLGGLAAYIKHLYQYHKINYCEDQNAYSVIGSMIEDVNN